MKVFAILLVVGLSAAHNIHHAPDPPGPVREIEVHVGEGETVTVEVTKTDFVDEFVTKNVVFTNTVFVTQTDFSFITVTSATQKVIRTPVNYRVRVTTTGVVAPTTVTVTNKKVEPVFTTSTVTEFKALEHTRYWVDFITVTNTITQTHSVSPTIVSTEVVTDYVTRTVRRYTTVHAFSNVYGGYVPL